MELSNTIMWSNKIDYYKKSLSLLLLLLLLLYLIGVSAVSMATAFLRTVLSTLALIQFSFISWGFNIKLCIILKVSIDTIQFAIFVTSRVLRSTFCDITSIENYLCDRFITALF